VEGGQHTLDELDYDDRHAVAETAQHHPERSGRLSLTLASVNDQQPSFLGLGSQHSVAGRFAPSHFLVMPAVDFLLGVAEIVHRALHWAEDSRALFLRGPHRPRAVASAQR